MSRDDDEQGNYVQLLSHLDKEDSEMVISVIQAAEFDAAAVTLAKNQGLSEDTVTRKFTSDMQSKYDELIKKLSPHDQHVFIDAFEQAKMDGSKQPETAEKNLHDI